MHLRKTIVLVALAAVTAAPSALAMYPPIDASNPGTHIITTEAGLHKKAKRGQQAAAEALSALRRDAGHLPGVRLQP